MAKRNGELIYIFIHSTITNKCIEIKYAKDDKEIGEIFTSIVIGVKTNKFAMLKANADSKNPSWYNSAVADDFHG